MGRRSSRGARAARPPAINSPQSDLRPDLHTKALSLRSISSSTVLPDHIQINGARAARLPSRLGFVAQDLEHPPAS